MNIKKGGSPMVAVDMFSVVSAVIEQLDEARNEALQDGRIEEFYNNEYEHYFKALAQKTQGSLLWNENAADAIIDCGYTGEGLDHMLEVAEKQARWLREIGLCDIADRWLTNYEDAMVIANL